MLSPGECQGGAGHLQSPEPGHPGGHSLSVHPGQIPRRYCHQPLMETQENLHLRFEVLCFDKSLSRLYCENDLDLNSVKCEIHGLTSPVARELGPGSVF